MTVSNMKIGIGSCALGQAVRYNGGHKRPHAVIESLKHHVEFVSLCPELGIGLGVPRESIRLVTEKPEDAGANGELSVSLRDSKTQQKDHSRNMLGFARQHQAELNQLSGYIFIKGSPSCGLERVNRYDSDGQHLDNHGVGFFAEQVMAANPLLPVEEDGRLHDPGLCERFITKVYVWHAWRSLQSMLSHKGIIDFWADHKYLLMSRHYPSYKRVGQMLATAGKQNIDLLAADFIRLLMGGLNHIPSRKGHVNAMQHIKGYLKHDLSCEQIRDIDDKIEQYRLSTIPLVVPMSLLQHQFISYPHPYIERQVFMNPYPHELGLRNSI